MAPRGREHAGNNPRRGQVRSTACFEAELSIVPACSVYRARVRPRAEKERRALRWVEQLLEPWRAEELVRRAVGVSVRPCVCSWADVRRSRSRRSVGATMPTLSRSGQLSVSAATPFVGVAWVR